MEQTKPTATEALLDYAMTKEQVYHILHCIEYIEEKCQLPDIYEYLSNKGICSNLDRLLETFYIAPDNFYSENLDNILQDMFETWDNFSGQCMFPILTGESDYYRHYGDKHDIWFRWQGVQLEERLKLIKHMKKELSLVLDNMWLSTFSCEEDQHEK